MLLCFSPLQAPARNRLKHAALQLIYYTCLATCFLSNLLDCFSRLPHLHMMVWIHNSDSFVSSRKNMWVPFVQTSSRSFQTLCRDAKMNHLRPCRTRSTVEKWRYRLGTRLSRWFIMGCFCLNEHICIPSFRFCRSCWNIICKRGIKCFFFLCQPRWEQHLHKFKIWREFTHEGAEI